MGAKLKGNKVRKGRSSGPIDECGPLEEGEVPVVRAEGFCKSYGTRVLAMATEYDLRLMIANERIQGDDGLEFYVAESMVILTPQAAKEAVKDLGILVRQWEDGHGTIENRPKVRAFTRQAL